jgi:hypothetical protein
MALRAPVGNADQQFAKELCVLAKSRRMAKEKKKSPACRGEGSAAGLQLRVRFAPAALLDVAC